MRRVRHLPSVLRALTATLLVAVALGCTDSREAIRASLVCDECTRELQYVVSLGDDAVEVLRAALREGPNPQERAAYLEQTTDEWRAAKVGNVGVIGGLATLSDSVTFVTTGLANLVSTYQRRAAWNLRAIGTPAARAALHDANVDEANNVFSWPPEVRALVERLDSNDPITGVYVSSPVGALPIGGVAQLTAEVRGVGSVSQGVVWTTTNASIATITPNGVLLRVGPGPAVARACSTVVQSLCGVVVIAMP